MRPGRFPFWWGRFPICQFVGRGCPSPPSLRYGRFSTCRNSPAGLSQAVAQSCHGVRALTNRSLRAQPRLATRECGCAALPEARYPIAPQPRLRSGPSALLGVTLSLPALRELEGSKGGGHRRTRGEAWSLGTAYSPSAPHQQTCPPEAGLPASGGFPTCQPSALVGVRPTETPKKEKAAKRCLGAGVETAIESGLGAAVRKVSSRHGPPDVGVGFATELSREVNSATAPTRGCRHDSRSLFSLN